MRKNYFTYSSLLAVLLITALVFGACTEQSAIVEEDTPTDLPAAAGAAATILVGNTHSVKTRQQILDIQNSLANQQSVKNLANKIAARVSFYANHQTDAQRQDLYYLSISLANKIGSPSNVETINLTASEMSDISDAFTLDDIMTTDLLDDAAAIYSANPVLQDLTPLELTNVLNKAMSNVTYTRNPPAEYHEGGLFGPAMKSSSSCDVNEVQEFNSCIHEASAQFDELFGNAIAAGIIYGGACLVVSSVAAPTCILVGAGITGAWTMYNYGVMRYKAMQCQRNYGNHGCQCENSDSWFQLYCEYTPYNDGVGGGLGVPAGDPEYSHFNPALYDEPSGLDDRVVVYYDWSRVIVDGLFSAGCTPELFDAGGCGDSLAKSKKVPNGQNEF